MTEQLPITINVSPPLKAQYPKLCACCNKLEAQFNFQTMTANWYGDEDTIFFIDIELLLPDDYQTTLQAVNISNNELTRHADDVFIQKLSNKQLSAYLAITDAEQALISQHPKILAGLIEKKLGKVINIIATSKNLTII